MPQDRILCSYKKLIFPRVFNYLEKMLMIEIKKKNQTVELYILLVGTIKNWTYTQKNRLERKTPIKIIKQLHW